jgi:hypothetical protein
MWRGINVRRIQEIAVIFAVLTFFVSVWPGAAEAASNELVTVKVNIVIDNPDYFWQYPFGGKGADSIMISGMGKKDTIETSSTSKLVTFDVPKTYQFRMSLDLCNKAAVLKSFSFSKRDINENNSSFTIELKAPAPEQVKVESKEFDEIK